MTTRKLHGVVCASITPMHSDGSIDIASLRRLTQHLIKNGIHCLYPNGTNGESIALNQDERFQIARTIHEENAGRVALYVQCGAGTVAESYAHVRYCAELGVDGVGLMSPIFFALDDLALMQYYDAIMDRHPDLSMYAYNIPTRAGNDIRPEVLGALMTRHENLLGIKYSFPDIERIQAYLHCVPTRRPSVLIGCDSLALACMAVGGDGWVSGPSAVAPKLYTALSDALTAGDIAKARETQHAIVRLAQSIAGIPEIPAIKYLLMKQGIIESEACRAPLRPLTPPERARLDCLLEEIDGALG